MTLCNGYLLVSNCDDFLKLLVQFFEAGTKCSLRNRLSI
jgi:hypothetical protein